MVTPEARFTNRIQGVEEKITGIEDMRDEMDILVKESIKSKILLVLFRKCATL